MFLMLVGDAGFVTILASVMLSFVTLGKARQIALRLGVIVAGLGASAVLSDLDVRPATPRGDLAHKEAVSEQHHIMEEQAEEVSGVDSELDGEA